MAFSGRYEATKAPTVEKVRINTGSSTSSHKEDEGSLSDAKNSVSIVVGTVNAHILHASQATVRWLIPPTLRPVRLPLPPQSHSTALLSPKRYDDRFLG
jgi:hypothetical protein